MEELKTITTCSNIVEANIIVGFLESNGIKAEIFSDDCGGVYGFSFSDIRIVVRSEDEFRAIELLKQFGRK